MALFAVGCARPWQAGRHAVPDEAATIAPTAMASPTPPGVRLPGKVRAEAFWNEGIRYRFLDTPRLALEDGVPHVRLADEPLIAGRLGFKLNVDGAAFVERDGLESVPDRIEVRRAFLMTSGTVRLAHPLEYSLSFGLLGKRFYFDSGYLALRDLPWVGTLKVGAFDPPIGFDSLISNRDRVFMEVAAPLGAFVPGTLPGIQIGRPFQSERRTWTLGIFSVGQRRDVGDRSVGAARMVGRTTWLARDAEGGPVADGPDLLHLGVAASYVFSSDASVRYQTKPESFLAPIAVDTDTIDAHNAFVFGTEVAARRGPLSFQGEYLQAFVDGGSKTTFPGLYLSLAYLLTGEVRPYDRQQGVFGQVIPLHPFNLRARTFGAAECAARYSWVDLDDGPVAGGAMQLLSGGLNWYWNRYVRWQLGYELAFIDGGPLDGRLHILQARFQLVL